MPETRLDNKLDCKQCGKIHMDIPDHPDDDTVISCSDCGSPLGTWGELQTDFYKQIGDGVLDLRKGQIFKK